MTITKKVTVLIKLIRPVNCLMMGFAVIVGATLTGTLSQLHLQTYNIQNLYLGFITGFFLTGSTMAINDYVDRDIDIINEPTRPIPSGLIKPIEALILALLLVSIGFISAIVINWQSLLISLLAYCSFLLYITKGKHLGIVGNFLVSICIATPFIYGGYAVSRGLLMTTFSFVLIIFASNTGREIIKGIVDIEGDREHNIKTIAVVYGPKKAAIVASAFYLSAILLTPIPLLLKIVSIWYIPLVILTDIGLIFAIKSILSNYSRKNARKVKNVNLIWFTTGLLAFISGSF